MRLSVNLILEKTDQVKWFTNMREVFDATEIEPEDFDWYVSDIELNWKPPGFSSADQWISGKELATFLNEYEFQFIWGVFSAVPKGFRSTFSSIPYADGNQTYWSEEELAPQLQGAMFEIACWDSSAIILVNIPKSAADAFVSRYSDAKLLMNSRVLPNF